MTGRAEVGGSTSTELRRSADRFGLGDPDAVAALFLVSRLGRLNDAALDAIVRRHGIIVAEFYVLSPLLLGPDDELSVADLGRAVVQTSGGVTKTISRLEAGGLLRKRTNPDDGRVRLVSLTAAGRRTAAACLREAVAHYEIVLARLLDADTAHVIDSLATLLDVVETRDTDIVQAITERHASPR